MQVLQKLLLRMRVNLSIMIESNCNEAGWSFFSAIENPLFGVRRMREKASPLRRLSWGER